MTWPKQKHSALATLVIQDEGRAPEPSRCGRAWSLNLLMHGQLFRCGGPTVVADTIEDAAARFASILGTK